MIWLLGEAAGERPAGALLVLAAIAWLGFGQVALAWFFVGVVVVGPLVWRLVTAHPLAAAAAAGVVWVALEVAR